MDVIAYIRALNHKVATQIKLGLIFLTLPPMRFGSLGPSEFSQPFKLSNALYLSVNVFSTKLLIGDTILRGHPSHANVYPLALQRGYLPFSVTG